VAPWTALIGTHLSVASVMDWFGPRGLASIVFGLVYLEQEVHLPGEPTIRLALIVTVLASARTQRGAGYPIVRP
jgi:hypothetical protein